MAYFIYVHKDVEKCEKLEQIPGCVMNQAPLKC
jgi:hypothetical protein